MKMKLIQTNSITEKIEKTTVQYQIPGVDVDIAYLEQRIIFNKTFDKIEKRNNLKTGQSLPEILKECNPEFVKESFFKYIKTNNPFYGVNGDEVSSHIIHPEDYGNHTISNKNLVWFYYSGHMLFDLNCIPISIPHSYDYIGSPFNNEYCNLKNLLEYLKSHPWVVNKKELKIINIPYYNRSDTRNESLTDILIRPDQETYEKIYETVKDDTYFSVRVKEEISSYRYALGVSTHDWLGIKPFLKSK